MRDMMTTKEIAEYLRIKERKVYDLVREKRIPCARVTGKWLFPKALIDLWVLQGSEGPVSGAPAPPPIVAGSHDPLLEWSLRSAGTGLAILPGGSLDGLARLARREAMVCALHVPDEASGEYNVPLVKSALGGRGVVVIEWARRQQGLIVAQGNPHRITKVGDLTGKGITFVPRQEGAGSQILFVQLLAAAGIGSGDVTFTPDPARSETDVGIAVREGRAQVGLAVAEVARQFELDFVPLSDERFDLVMARRDYFEEPIQTLLNFARSTPFRRHVRGLDGYDVSGLGTVHYNGP